MADLTPEQQQHEDRRKELLAALLLLRRRMEKDLGDLLKRFGAGEITAIQLGNDGLPMLAKYHTDAVGLGRQLAGVEDGSADSFYGAAVAYEEASYLAHFVTDIQDGRYGGGATQEPLNEEAIIKRAGVYAEKLVATANHGWLNHLNGLDEVWWLCLDDASSCTECPELAAGSPYAIDALPKTPGEAQCGPRCRCELQLRGGERGFQWED